MSSLKPKVHEIKPGVLRWILRTALPLRPDFGIWLNGEKLSSSKKGRGLLKSWVLGKDLVKLPKPGPSGVEVSEDIDVALCSAHRFGLDVPNLGRVTGYAETYKDLLTGKSDEISRSHGFFVYVYGRLLNVADGHFGISPHELRHGTFGRFRLVVNMDGLDAGLRSNREAIGQGPLLATAQDVLRAIFNTARSAIEKHDGEDESGAKLVRQLAASPPSLVRTPIVALARAVAEGRSTARHLIVPRHESDAARDEYVASRPRPPRSLALNPRAKPAPGGQPAMPLPTQDREAPVSLEAKSKVQPGAKVSEKDVNVAAIRRHRKLFECDHAIVVGPDFPTSQGDNSALGESTEAYGPDSAGGEGPRTLTLIRVDDLALLVRLRAVKQVGLLKMRELFMDCRLPEQSSEWVRAIQDSDVPRPPYREIVETIGALQKKFKMAPVSYSSLRVELSHRTPAIDYERDDELVELCRGMAQMAPGAIFASSEKVELDQSAENVIGSIERALQEFTPDEPGGSEKR